MLQHVALTVSVEIKIIVKKNVNSILIVLVLNVVLMVFVLLEVSVPIKHLEKNVKKVKNAQQDTAIGINVGGEF